MNLDESQIKRNKVILALTYLIWIWNWNVTQKLAVDRETNFTLIINYKEYQKKK